MRGFFPLQIFRMGNGVKKLKNKTRENRKKLEIDKIYTTNYKVCLC
jgi:hypothetical protein